MHLQKRFKNTAPIITGVVHATSNSKYIYSPVVQCNHCVLTLVFVTDIFTEYTIPHPLVLAEVTCSYQKFSHTFSLHFLIIWARKLSPDLHSVLLIICAQWRVNDGHIIKINMLIQHTLWFALTTCNKLLTPTRAFTAFILRNSSYYLFVFESHLYLSSAQSTLLVQL